MSLADYLAKNYLTADPGPDKKAKKRKRKQPASDGLVIADDDASGWNTQGAQNKEEDDAPVTGMTCSPANSYNSLPPNIPISPRP